METTELTQQQVAEIFEAIGPVMLITSLVVIIGLGPLMFWGIMTKAGRSGWKSLIPVYQWGQVSEIAGKPGWWGWLIGISQLLPIVFVSFLFDSFADVMATQDPTQIPQGFGLFGIVWLAALVGFIFQILLAIAVPKVFGLSDGWAVGLILLPIVFYPIISFGSSRYLGPNPQPPAPPLPPANDPPPPPHTVDPPTT